MTKKLRNLLLIATTALCFCLFFAVNIKADAADDVIQQTSQTTTSVTLQWTPYIPSVGYYVDHYELKITNYNDSTDTVTFNEPATATSDTISNLPVGTKMWVDLTCVYTDGTYSYKHYYGSIKAVSTPGKVTGLALSSFNTSGNIKVTWTDQANEDGYHYQIINYTTGGKTKTNADRYTNYLYETISQKYSYKIRVRSYMKKADGTKVYGAWSSYKYVVPQPKVKFTLKSGRKVKFSWTKVTGATKYVLKLSTKKSSGYKTVATIKQPKTKTVSKTIGTFNKKKFAKNKNYYVRLYVYKKMGSKTYTNKISDQQYFYIY